jgi:PAS domain S-box-containing protein
MRDKIMENTRYKILLIEDDKLDRIAFKRMLEEEELPYDCTVAGSVSEARDILSSERFDVVISDYSLGDGTAFDIIDLASNTPIILVTGVGNEEIATKAWKAGAYDYLIKDHEQNYLKTVPITIENAVKHKRMESRLRLLSHAVVSTDDCVYITDLDDKITFVNRAFCETYGYEEKEVIGKDSNILWNKGPVDADMENTYEAVGGWEVGFFHRRKDGSEFPVSLSRSDVTDENGNEVALVVIARDISERMKIEAELRTSNQELIKENRLIKEFAVALCHQLTEPITELGNIIADAMRASAVQTDAQLRNGLELADKNINAVTGIIGNFLEVSRIDKDKINMAITELGLYSVVSQVLKALTPLATEKGIKLESPVPESGLDTNADWDRIVQSLTKLVGEAAKAVPAESGVDV